MSPPQRRKSSTILGRRAARAGDREQRIEEKRLVLAARSRDRAAMQPFARDVEHFEGDVAQGPAAVRRIEPQPRHVVTHRLAFLLGPVGDEIARRTSAVPS